MKTSVLKETAWCFTADNENEHAVAHFMAHAACPHRALRSQAGKRRELG